MQANSMGSPKSDCTLPYDQYKFDKRPNYDEVTDYLSSKLLEKLLIRPFDNGDNITDRSIRIACYKNREELHRTEKLLEDKRQLNKMKRQHFDKQWNDLKTQKLDFSNNFIKFDKFVEENEDKRRRATNKISKESELLSKRMAGIEKLQKDCQDAIEVKQSMDNQIAELQIYEEYLAQVAKKFPKYFSNVDNILERFGSLLDARIDLQEFQESNFRQLESIQKSLDRLTEDYLVQISGLNTKFLELHRRYECSRADSLKWESLLKDIAVEALERVRERVLIKDTCWRIYKEMCERKKMEPVHKRNLSEQFDFIKKTLFEYRRVNEMLKAAEEENKEVSEKALASSKI